MHHELFSVLILGMGGEVSKGIYKAVKLSQIPCYIIGACISENSDGLYLCDEAYISPLAAEEEFIPWLINICNQRNVDIVLSGVEENITAIALSLSTLQEKTKAIFRVSSVDALNIGNDKWNTCQWLKNKGFPTPRYARAEVSEEISKLIEETQFPLIAKPRRGKSSQGVILLRDKKDLQQIVNREQYLIEEYVGTPENEYTVGCYRGIKGEIPEPIIMRRTLKNGSSQRTEVCENIEIKKLCTDICKEFNPNGPFNIQLRLSEDGTPIPFEFNVRFSGTTPMRAHFGFCDVKAMLTESLLKKPIEDCFHIKTGISFRFADEIYISNREIDSDGRLHWRSIAQ